MSLLRLNERRENAERLAQEVANNYNVSTKVFEEADDAMEEADVATRKVNCIDISNCHYCSN
jgi:uncharacterized coiled-coil DUF342 family protein